jgi:bacterioferritin
MASAPSDAMVLARAGAAGSVGRDEVGRFELDLASIRDRALLDMEDGPVTPPYGANVDAVVKVLNDVVATEVVCWLRYRQHSTVAAGPDSGPVSRAFAEYADAELHHCLWLAQRVRELGGDPDLDPEHLRDRSVTEYRRYRATNLVGMLKENLIAERIVIQVYREIIRWLGDTDPTSRRLLEHVLADEEGHAAGLRDLLGDAGE